MRVEYRASALADAEAAVDWLNEQRTGLGDRFATQLTSVLRKVSQFPRMHPVVRNGIRRAVMPVFKYGVYYLVEAERIVVLAVRHSSRDEPDFDNLF